MIPSEVTGNRLALRHRRPWPKHSVTVVLVLLSPRRTCLSASVSALERTRCIGNMSSLDLTRDWLNNVLRPYPARERLVAEVMDILRARRTLAVKTDAFSQCTFSRLGQTG